MIRYWEKKSHIWMYALERGIKTNITEIILYEDICTDFFKYFIHLVIKSVFFNQRITQFRAMEDLRQF